MGTKSIRHIVEATLATYLSTQTGLTTVAFLTGDSAATQTLPKAVVLCESARSPADLPEGGNMRDLTSIKAAFVTSTDAACYDVTVVSEDEGIDERSWATSFAFDVLVVLPA
jgi:hypothetical protein